MVLGTTGLGTTGLGTMSRARGLQANFYLRKAEVIAVLRTKHDFLKDDNFNES
jgi:hypothetical protein